MKSAFLNGFLDEEVYVEFMENNLGAKKVKFWDLKKPYMG